MVKTYTYPHWETSVIDNSIYNAVDTESLPLHRPIFFMRAAKGPSGVPIWISGYNEAKSTFGDATFDADSEYYSREALYLTKLFSRQGAFITRMVSSDAQYASCVLELQVKKTDVVQYKRNADGQYIYDVATGEKIPETDSTGATVTEPGIELKWTSRALKLNDHNPETVVGLKPTTYSSGGSEYTIYPILAVKANYVGSAYNSVGFKFFVDLDNLDETLAETVQALPYEFGAVEKDYKDDTVSPIYSSINKNAFEAVILKPNMKDTRIDKNVSFDNIITDNYADVLPFTIHLYAENIKTIGSIIQGVEDEDMTISDPYLVNLTTPKNIDGEAMPHVVLSEDDDSIVLNSTRILYLTGGTDGSIDDTVIESLTRQYLRDLVYPELLDQPRYPFTHIYDTGVTIDTKRAFIEFMGVHDSFKVVLSTQDAHMKMNTKSEDLSMGSSLYSSCLLQPESVEKGTECCRAEIYQQCGHLADSTYKDIIPSTIDVMLKKSRVESTEVIAGTFGGLPNSAVTVFKDWNWTPCDADHKQRSWDAGLNYFQYYDRKSVHWPAMRTVYRYDTSVLTSAMFTDVVVFAKHIARSNWSKFTGVELPFDIVGPRAAFKLSNDLSSMLNGLYNFNVTFQQSEEEARIGYISHALIQLWGNPQQRVWKIDIECYRNGYDPTNVGTQES